MLKIANSDASHVHAALNSHGGFLWWYADLRNSDGDGLVLIWSLGLPFLPGSREATTPEQRPSMALSLYESGKQTCYLLQEYTAEQSSIDARSGCGTIGKSRYELACDGQQCVLRVCLDEPLAASGQRISGTISMTGAQVQLTNAPAGSKHSWSPLSLRAQGSAQLTIGKRTVHLQGSGYVDSNVSQIPLHDQGIESWRWGRVTFPHYSLVYYEVEETEGCILRYLLRQDSSGKMQQPAARLTFTDFKRGTYGIRAPRETEIRLIDAVVRIQSTSVVDDAPFYQRQLTHAVDSAGNIGSGVSEVVAPSQIDKPWQRPFVKMKTHRVGQANSRWLPLFTGTPQGRALRLIRSLSGQGLA